MNSLNLKEIVLVNSVKSRKSNLIDRLVWSPELDATCLKMATSLPRDGSFWVRLVSGPDAPTSIYVNLLDGRPAAVTPRFESKQLGAKILRLLKEKCGLDGQERADFWLYFSADPSPGLPPGVSEANALRLKALTPDESRSAPLTLKDSEFVANLGTKFQAYRETRRPRFPETQPNELKLAVASLSAPSRYRKPASRFSLRIGQKLTGLKTKSLETSIARFIHEESDRLGLALPELTIETCTSLEPRHWRIEVLGEVVGRGAIPLGHTLIQPHDEECRRELLRMGSISDTHWSPLWVPTKKLAELKELGYSHPDLLQVVWLKLLKRSLTQHLADLFTLDTLREMLDGLTKTEPLLSAWAKESPQSFTILGVFRKLLSESVPVKDASRILHTILGARDNKCLQEITELVRLELAPSIIDPYIRSHALYFIGLEQGWERLFRSVLDPSPKTPDSGDLWSKIYELIDRLTETLEDASALGHSPVLVVANDIRWMLKLVTKEFLPELTVISNNELKRVLLQTNFRDLGLVEW